MHAYRGYCITSRSNPNTTLPAKASDRTAATMNTRGKKVNYTEVVIVPKESLASPPPIPSKTKTHSLDREMGKALSHSHTHTHTHHSTSTCICTCKTFV